MSFKRYGFWSIDQKINWDLTSDMYSRFLDVEVIFDKNVRRSKPSILK